MASNFTKDHLSEFVSLFFENVFTMCMDYYPPFLGIIFGCVPLDIVNLKNAFPRTCSSENGTLDFLRSLSIPFAFLFAFPKHSGNAFPVRLLLSGTVCAATKVGTVLNFCLIVNINMQTLHTILHIFFIELVQRICLNIKPFCPW